MTTSAGGIAIPYYIGAVFLGVLGPRAARGLACIGRVRIYTEDDAA